MKVIIAGSRSFQRSISPSKLNTIICEAIAESGFQITEVISGTALGVDMAGEIWAEKNNISIDRYPAAWDDLTIPGAVIRNNKFGQPYNLHAGFIRNEQMAKVAEALILIWDGESRGSKDMLKHAKTYQLKIFIKKVVL